VSGTGAAWTTAAQTSTSVRYLGFALAPRHAAPVGAHSSPGLPLEAYVRFVIRRASRVGTRTGGGPLMQSTTLNDGVPRYPWLRESSQLLTPAMWAPAGFGYDSGIDCFGARYF
jgi:hypothetical protein